MAIKKATKKSTIKKATPKKTLVKTSDKNPAKTPAKKRDLTVALKKRIEELEREVTAGKEALENSQADYGKCLETLINERGGKSHALGYILYGLAQMGITLEQVVRKCQAIAKLAAPSGNPKGVK